METNHEQVRGLRDAIMEAEIDLDHAIGGRLDFQHTG